MMGLQMLFPSTSLHHAWWVGAWVWWPALFDFYLFPSIVWKIIPTVMIGNSPRYSPFPWYVWIWIYREKIIETIRKFVDLGWPLSSARRFREKPAYPSPSKILCEYGRSWTYLFHSPQHEFPWRWNKNVVPPLWTFHLHVQISFAGRFSLLGELNSNSHSLHRSAISSISLTEYGASWTCWIFPLSFGLYHPTLFPRLKHFSWASL